MLGDKLRLARKKMGLSLRGLSKKLKEEARVSAQAIGKYERGEMVPSSTVLIALSQALAEPVDYFMSPMDAKLRDVDFRKKSGISARDQARVRSAVLDHAERYLVIENILELNSATWNAPCKPVALGNIEDAEVLAQKVRRKWDLGGGPIPDMTELLEEQGLKVLAIGLPEKVAGLTCLVEHMDSSIPVPMIAVNATHGVERRRMTLAHELAHRVIDPASSVNLGKAATRFAGAFLIPAAHLKREVGKDRHSVKGNEIMALKHRYRVSAVSLLVRMEQVGIIRSSKLAYMMQTEGRGWRTQEPQPIKDDVTEKATRFKRLCFRALNEGEISLPKTSELLRTPVVEIWQERMQKGASASAVYCP